jgi:hypothetical protein
MLRCFTVGLATLAGCGIWMSGARADSSFRVLHGPPVVVAQGLPSPIVTGTFVATPARPPTLAEFAERFRPTPGRHEVVLLHPDTGCPVPVCFNLPCGYPRRLCVHKRELVYDYGREEVKIRMTLGGGVRVVYH